MAGITWRTTADLMGVFPADLDDLLQGQCNATVANRLGVSMLDVEDFIRGSVSLNMAARLGLSPPAAADEFGRVLGREGAIGLILGLLIFA